MQAPLALTMFQIMENEEWSIEKHWLGLSLAHSRLSFTLVGIRGIPIKPVDFPKINYRSLFS